MAAPCPAVPVERLLGTVPSVPDWLISPRSGVAYLDLRGKHVDLDDVEGLVDTLGPYFDRQHVSHVIVALKGPQTAAIEVLTDALKSQAKARGVAFALQQE